MNYGNLFLMAWVAFGITSFIIGVRSVREDSRPWGAWPLGERMAVSFMLFATLLCPPLFWLLILIWNKSENKRWSFSLTPPR